MAATTIAKLSPVKLSNFCAWEELPAASALCLGRISRARCSLRLPEAGTRESCDWCLAYTEAEKPMRPNCELRGLAPRGCGAEVTLSEVARKPLAVHTTLSEYTQALTE